MTSFFRTRTPQSRDCLLGYVGGVRNCVAQGTDRFPLRTVLELAHRHWADGGPGLAFVVGACCFMPFACCEGGFLHAEPSLQFL